MIKKTALFLAAIALQACSKPTQSDSMQKVRLAIGFIPNIQFAPLYVAQQQGYFAEEGLDLQISYGLGTDIFSLIGQNKTDIGLSDSDQLLAASEKGVKAQAFFQYYSQYPVSIVAKDPNLQKPEELAGKTIGVPELFGSSYIGLVEFLDKFNLNGKVKVERIGYTQLAALEKGLIDAAVCFSNNEPIVLKERGQSFTEWQVRDFSPLAGAAFLASSQALMQNRELYEKFSRALAKGIAFTRDQPAAAADIVMPIIGAAAEQRAFLLAALQATNSFYSPDGALSAQTYRFTAQRMFALGLLQKPAAIENLLFYFNEK